MSRVGSVAGAALGDGDSHIVLTGDVGAAPACEGEAWPGGIGQRDGITFHRIGCRVAGCAAI